MDKKLEDYVISIPDFPVPGILYRDITGIMRNGAALQMAIDRLTEIIKTTDCDLVAGTESRGFIFGVPVAVKLGKGFIPVRKAGKLPRETVSEEYALEYGTAKIEIHKDDIQPGMKVALIDDLLATGGTAEAAVKLIESLGAKVVKIAFVIELYDLEGRSKLVGYDVESLIRFPGH